MHTSGAYSEIGIAAWENQDVLAALGKPGPATYWALLEKISYTNGEWTLDALFPIRGSEGSGRIEFHAVTRGAFTGMNWQVQGALTYEKDGRRHRIPLVAPVPDK